MSLKIRKIAPEEIEAESFRIIEEELGEHRFDPFPFKIVQRVIHATGDFSFADNFRFAPGALARAVQAIKTGKDIITDVNMVATGINKKSLSGFGVRVHCLVADEDVAQLAKKRGRTRSEVAIQAGLERNDIGIIAVGNAPTALLMAMECLALMEPSTRPVIIGVPVGFVNAEESKAMLEKTDFPFITSLGRKGGSPVAAAIVNACIRLAAV